MSMKMSEAVVDVVVNEVVEENVSTAQEPKFKVISTTDLKNPFTFTDEDSGFQFSNLQRKQVVQLIAVAFVFFTLVSLIQNALHASRAAAIIEAAPLEQVVVSEGDSLWNIAADSSQGKMDVSEFVYHIKQINELESSSLKVGQVLSVPIL